jgi:transposase InsO family protein
MVGEFAQYATLEWVDWSNNRRLIKLIGWTTPVEYEKAYFRDHAASEETA